MCICAVIIHGCALRHLSVIIDELWEIHPAMLNEDAQTLCLSLTHSETLVDVEAMGTWGHKGFAWRLPQIARALNQVIQAVSAHAHTTFVL